ncbi:MAG: acyl carrier protein [Methylococcaceae bacterium]
MKSNDIELVNLKDNIIKFLANELAIDTSQINNQSLIFSTGIIDSFSLISLIAFLEKQLGFQINAMDINLDNLDSIERIVTYVNRITAIP